MAKNSIRLEINFHQSNEVSVFLESTASGKNAQYGEMLLLSYLAIRQLCNFKNNEVGSSLSSLLNNFSSNDLKEQILSSDPVKLINYPGTKGRKRFIATLKFTDSDGLESAFNLKSKGFGLLAQGIGFYAPTSIIILAAYLAKQNQDNEEYLNMISESLNYCAKFYFSGKLTHGTSRTFATVSANESSKFKSINN